MFDKSYEVNLSDRVKLQQPKINAYELVYWKIDKKVDKYLK